MQRDQPGAPQDRLAQPLQTEDEEQRADDEPQVVDRDERQRGAERGDDGGQRDDRGAHAGQRGAPVTGRAHREHDRQRLDHLDRAREERRDDEEAGGHE